MGNSPIVSIVVVSFRCLPLLRLMLTSLHKSLEGIDNEVFVVDNASSDGTVECLREHFGWVTTIASDENIGFSKANNIALKRCRGKVVILLNPDTVIPKTFVSDVVSYFEANPQSGAIGVQMTNGNGKFLKESKRGYTDVRTSFYKITGLWRVCPKSAVVNAYYAGNVRRDDSAEVPILSGACMAFTHELLDKVGYFDEEYFMYGEDIDLSWRMHCKSLGNRYLGNINIVHFKGMSTPRHLKYIRAFYEAMKKFACKYEFPKRSWAVNAFVLMGINVGFWIGCVKCVILRVKDKLNKDVKPQSVTFVSKSASNGEAFVLKNKDINVYLASDLTKVKREVKHVVFDIDDDINASIEFMKVNKCRYKYSFYSSEEDLVVSNSCHNNKI